MSTKAAARPHPHPREARPLAERARDYAIVVGGSGAFAGACATTVHHGSAFRGAAFVGVPAATIAASFIGLRHLLLQGQFENDKEAVSGLAAGILGLGLGTLRAGPQVGATAGFGAFCAGCVLHHAHRWWLHARLVNNW